MLEIHSLPGAAPAIAPAQEATVAARDWLLARQAPEGWWCGELESDATLESYFILLQAFLGHRDAAKIPRLVRTLRRKMLADGGWSTYPGGPPEVSISCLAYFALKVAGASPAEPDMRRAREVIHSLGGIAATNSYTKYYLAFFGQYDWMDVPAIPPEMILLPPGAPFSVYDMSSWSRTIFVPLSILWALRPVCALPLECHVRELEAGTEAAEPSGRPGGGDWRSRSLRRFFLATDRVIKLYERSPIVHAGSRRRALARAERWILDRLADSDGLSAILPAMVNSVLALRCLGYAEDHPLVKQGLAQLDALEIQDSATGSIRVQPCLSPVWDTAISVYGLGQAGLPPNHPAMTRAASWLLRKQCTQPGDWSMRNPALPGGWCFEFRNPFYPDVDDTCMTLMALEHARATDGETVQRAAIRRGLHWMLGMQNQDGGWASFDRGNDKRWLTQVPFADHNAMIDPSTADVTGRVLESLSYHPGFLPHHPVVRRAVEFLQKDQCHDGSWFGRWGVNYLYGTWQALRGLRLIGEDMTSLTVRRGVQWLEAHQNLDGGWGESIASYTDESAKGRGASTASQTAWALMGLIAGGEGRGAAARRGADHLLRTQTAEGTWEQGPWTGTGFPRVFYLRYHYYPHYFPMMALAQYARVSSG